MLYYSFIYKENLKSIILFFAIFFYGLNCYNLTFLFSTLFGKVKTAGIAISYIVLILIFCNIGTSYVDIEIKVLKTKIQCINITFSSLIESNADVLFQGLVFTNILYLILTSIFNSLFSEINDSTYLEQYLKEILTCNPNYHIPNQKPLCMLAYELITWIELDSMNPIEGSTAGEQAGNFYKTIFHIYQIFEMVDQRIMTLKLVSNWSIVEERYKICSIIFMNISKYSMNELNVNRIHSGNRRMDKKYGSKIK
ncbi:hypothetical protein H8356DRAFT_1361214 [Neocallimastix lanati (nom. inval.)]|nr:hypothetical protein H8356DRAFT_1361214 [Neocallimastix sp. JGI-2020a]